jgi:Caspase domain
MASSKSALIIASSNYADPELRRLQAPASDARALAAVLRDPQVGGFEVATSLNEPAHKVSLAVEEFFADRRPDDLLLLHFSCHGVKDEDGELYFAMADTLVRRLAATGVAANFVNRRMSRSRSRRVVLLLDCCYAGAFERGMTARADGDAGIEAQFAGGRGRAVITASSAMEYAFENGELADVGEPAPSVFTSALVQGLETGEADRDQDGRVALDELYDYIYDKVQSATPHQTPCKWTYGIQGELFIARRGRPVTTPTPLPREFQDAIGSPFPAVRAGVVRELERLLHGPHEGMALAARLTLEELTNDDSRSVAAAALAAVTSIGAPAADAPVDVPAVDDPAVDVLAADDPAVDVLAADVPAADAEERQTVPPGSEPQAASIPAAPTETEALPVPADTSPADTTAVSTSAAGPSSRPLSPGFLALAVMLGIAALDLLVKALLGQAWPWWIVFGLGALGILASAVQRQRLLFVQLLLLWNLSWFVVYSLSVILTIHSKVPTVFGVLGTELIVLAVVNVLLGITALALQRPLAMIFAGLTAAAAILVAVALHHPSIAWAHAAGWTTLAAALAALLMLRRTAT